MEGGRGITVSILMEIRKDVQNIAEAIASVIGVDVTIVDEQLCRVAGTGEYSSMIGQTVDSSSVFHLVLETGKGYMVENPRNTPLCLNCGNRLSCKEFGEVCSPILVRGDAIGIIALIAFTGEQRDRLFGDIQNLMGFLERMADLIATKVIEKEKTDSLQLMTKQMNTIINSIEEGIIATNAEGEIVRCNQAAQVLFGLSEGNIRQFIPEFDRLVTEVKKGINIKNREFLYNRKNYPLRGTYSVNPVIVDGGLTGMVFTIREISQVHRAINDVIGLTHNTSFDVIIGESLPLLEIKERAIKAAASSSTVLIQGESGTGKELFARAIHSASPRRNKPFVAINCAAIPEQLLESELFGYEEGAFTGATRGGKSGKFELADGGTVFLDEIGDMPLHLQSKLLRVLQEKKIDRIGGRVPIPVDVRIIAATNVDLEEKVALGEFRQDLFFRLNVIPILIPPLRDRKEDIPILMDYLLTKCNNKLGKNIQGFSMEVVSLFSRYHWPGNVRELENVIEYAVNMEQRKVITLQSLPLRLRQNGSRVTESGFPEVRSLEDIEREAIYNALRVYRNKDKAAAALGIGRATLYRKIKKYNIISR